MCVWVVVPKVHEWIHPIQVNVSSLLFILWFPLLEVVDMLSVCLSNYKWMDISRCDLCLGNAKSVCWL